MLDEELLMYRREYVNVMKSDLHDPLEVVFFFLLFDIDITI